MIKIVIERRIMPGLEAEYDEAARDAMRACVTARGFIAGESLCERQRSEHRLLITQWRDLSAWKDWLQSAERERAMLRLMPLLAEEERIRVYDHC